MTSRFHVIAKKIHRWIHVEPDSNKELFLIKDCCVGFKETTVMKSVKSQMSAEGHFFAFSVEHDFVMETLKMIGVGLAYCCQSCGFIEELNKELVLNSWLGGTSSICKSRPIKDIDANQIKKKPPNIS